MTAVPPVTGALFGGAELELPLVAQADTATASAAAPTHSAAFPPLTPNLRRVPT